MHDDRPEIDRAGFDRLLEDLGPAVVAYLGEPPPSPARCFTVLNAMAVMISPVLAGAPDHIRDWFDDCLTESIDDIRGQADERAKNRAS